MVYHTNLTSEKPTFQEIPAPLKIAVTSPSGRDTNAEHGYSFLPKLSRWWGNFLSKGGVR